jgi:6-pyruvoyltetrahydropterin/6-carboxytetrahydropterin synthase
MKTVRITKIFRFEMAHALWNYNGKCRNIHGHSYELFVTVQGIPKQTKGDPEDGMLMDFGHLKKLIQNNVIDLFDHAFVISEHSPQAKDFSNMQIPFENVMIVPFQPTSENLILHFAEIITSLLPHHVSLCYLKLRETDSSYVEWFAQQ